MSAVVVKAALLQGFVAVDCLDGKNGPDQQLMPLIGAEGLCPFDRDS